MYFVIFVDKIHKKDYHFVMNNFPRLINIDPEQKSSIFLFGPRATGKTTWLRKHFSQAIVIDLLKTEDYHNLLSNPSRLEHRIPPHFSGWVIIDEIQKVPMLLNEVHRLIETYGYRFILTGSSARSLRRKGINLLAGRALDYRMHPLTCQEMQKSFSLEQALQFGLLPAVYNAADPKHYLSTYITAYLREEILQEGITRNIAEFSRFLEIASFSQGALLNLSEIARESGIERRTVNEYFSILGDLLIGFELPAFTKRAKRRLMTHSKFYYFDTGIYRTLRPKGPFDRADEIDGPALETLFFQHLRAINDYFRLGYTFYFWRTSNQAEVDFIAYGERGLLAFEIKRSKTILPKDLKNLKLFQSDYEMAHLFMLYGGEHEEYYDNIRVLPFTKALFQLKEILENPLSTSN